MYKIIAGILLTFTATAVFSQGSRPLPGIPSLAIKSKIASTSLAHATLHIETNQTITGLENCSCISGCYLLPVKLLSFEGRRVNIELVQLSWKTSNESQNKGFEVERSWGNTSTFQPVAFVPAQAGAALSFEYKLPDSNNFSGISYYRLKQVDIDGAFTYSPTIAIKGYAKQQALSLYPNPVAGKFLADVFALEKADAVLEISDAAGKRLFRQPVRLAKGINLFDMPATNLQPGVYFLQVLSPGMSPLGGKFVKL